MVLLAATLLIYFWFELSFQLRNLIKISVQKPIKFKVWIYKGFSLLICFRLCVEVPVYVVKI